MDNWLSSFDGGYPIHPFLLHSAATANAGAFIAGSFPVQMPNAPVPSTSAAAAAPAAVQDTMEYCARRRYKTTEQRIVRMYRGEDDDEIMPTTLMRVSLICPITRKRLATPARGMLCKHLQCFELQAYVAMNDQSQKWKCGVCLGCVKKERLVVDEYFLKVLEDVDPNVDEVELQENGSFRAVTAAPNNPAVVVPVDIGSAEEDDDDDCLVVGFTTGAAPKPARLRPKQELRDVVEEQPQGGEAAAEEQALGGGPPVEEESDDSDIIFIEEVQGNPLLPPVALRQLHVTTSSSSSSDSDDEGRPRYDLRRRPKRRQRKPPNQGSGSRRVRSRSFVDSDEDESGESGLLYALNDGSEHEMDDGTPIEDDEEENEANEDDVPQSDEEEEEDDEASPEQDAESEDEDSDWDLRAISGENVQRSADASLPGSDQRVTRSRARSSVEGEAPQAAATISGSNVEDEAPRAPTVSGSNMKPASLQDIPPEIRAQLSESVEQLIRMEQAARGLDEQAVAQRIYERQRSTIQRLQEEAVAAQPCAVAQAATEATSTAGDSSASEKAVKVSENILATLDRMMTDRAGCVRSGPASSTTSGSTSESGYFGGSGGQARSVRDMPGTSTSSSSAAPHGGSGHHCVLCDLRVERSVIMEHLRSVEPEGGSVEPSRPAICASSQPTFPGRDEPTALASEVPHPTVTGRDSHDDEPSTKRVRLTEGQLHNGQQQTSQGVEEKGVLDSAGMVLTAGASLPVPDTGRFGTVDGRLQETQSLVAKDSANGAASNVAETEVPAGATHQMPSQNSSSMEDEAASE